MNDSLIIKGFKCFLDIKIPLNGLTVLAGGNSVGKSSVIQSLLLMRSALEKISSGSDRVALNGVYTLGLGNSFDIIARNAPSDIIHIAYIYRGYTEQVKFFVDSKEPEVYLKIKHPEVSSVRYDIPPKHPIREINFHYLHAERLGPRPFYGVTDRNRNVGSQGEFTISLLSSNLAETKELDVPKERMFQDTANPRLRYQAEAWMNFIIPGTTMDPQKIREINQSYVQYGQSNPYNVGFGISYVLPIIVSGLIARKGEMLIVENPEAHLHPSGQSHIGWFLAKIAASGVQLLLETHSEHVINGIRIASMDGTIKNGDVIVNFFRKENENSEVKLKSIDINDAGDLTSYPRGFFDQQQKDFAEIVKHKRKRQGYQ